MNGIELPLTRRHSKGSHNNTVGGQIVGYICESAAWHVQTRNEMGRPGHAERAKPEWVV